MSNQTINSNTSIQAPLITTANTATINQITSSVSAGNYYCTSVQDITSTTYLNLDCDRVSISGIDIVDLIFAIIEKDYKKLAVWLTSDNQGQRAIGQQIIKRLKIERE